MKNIVLIGMPGVGKSTLGVILAKVIGYRFIDTDLIIQEKSGKLLKEIIAEKGVDGFIDYENEICASVKAEKCVIATGGSAVYGDIAMEHLRTIGTVIYLRADYETVARRVSDISGRGVVTRQGQSLLDIFNERSPLYEKYAHIICDMDGKTVEDNLKTVLKAIEKLFFRARLFFSFCFIYGNRDNRRQGKNHKKRHNKYRSAHQNIKFQK